MPNVYSDLQAFQTRYNNAQPFDAADAAEVLRALETASRRVDQFCHRQFYATTATRVFDGTGKDPSNTDYLAWATRTLFTGAMSFVRIPDCLAATSVALDQNSDRVFETVLDPAKDYYLVNEGADNQDATPFDKLQLDIFNGSVTVFSSRPRLVQIVGRWGYSETTEGVTPTATVTDATTTALTSSAAGDLAIGQTLLLGSEQVYVSAGGGTTWTIQRGVNGTTAATHNAGTAIQRFAWVPEVREACLFMAGRQWERRKAAASNIVQTDATGTIQMYTGGIDNEVREMLRDVIKVVL